jgi:pimeloyl-ACP methyl ester carboxylesterase
MKHFFTKLTVVLFAVTLFSSQAKSQNPAYTTQLLKHFSIAQIDSMLNANGVPGALFILNYEVDVYRIIYRTPAAAGDSLTSASGLVILPVADTCGVPIISYDHGTQLKKNDCFSNLSGEWFLGVVSAATGYAAVLPDYLGMGYSPVFHPYQHAKTEASATIDLIRVCKDLSAQNDVNLNGQIFLMGYSQGGHAAMATHKAMQEDFPNEFTVTASAPMSGAYDMSGAQFDFVASFAPYSQPGYLPYLIKGYHEAYGDALYTNWSDILKSPYDVTLPPLLSGNYYMDAVNNAMPNVPREIIDSAYSAAFFADSLHPFRIALKENNVYNWVPNCPMRLNYCTSDEEVNPQNAVVAYNWMTTQGAVQVQKINRSETLSHFECAQPSIVLTKFWFDSLATFCASTVGLNEKPYTSQGWTVGNNYQEGKLMGQVSNYAGHNFDVYIYSSTGKLVKAQQDINTANFTIDISTLPSGMYVVWSNLGAGLWAKFIR